MERSQFAQILEECFALHRKISRDIIYNGLLYLREMYLIMTIRIDRSHREFATVNDPIAGSPTITLLRLFLPPIQSIRSNFPKRILATHNEYQSEETTGGVYKRQGRIQHAILEHSYKGFLVQVRKLQQTIPFTGWYLWFTLPFGSSNTFYHPL